MLFVFFIHITINETIKMFICASPKRILNQSQGHMPLTLECDGEEQTVVWPWLDLGSDPPSTPSAPHVTAGKLVND